MSKFWTCGPFKEAEDNLEKTIFRAEQMKIFLELLEELDRVDYLIENGSKEEKLLASMVKLDLDEKLQILLGTGDEQQAENDKIPGKTILESFEGSTEK